MKKMQAQVEQKPALDEIPRAQRRALIQALTDFERRYPRKEAMARAYLQVSTACWLSQSTSGCTIRR
ncbi:hypothetical protein [Thiobacillus sp.]